MQKKIINLILVGVILATLGLTVFDPPKLHSYYPGVEGPLLYFQLVLCCSNLYDCCYHRCYNFDMDNALQPPGLFEEYQICHANCVDSKWYECLSHDIQSN